VSRRACAFLFLEELDPPVIVMPLDSILPRFPQYVQISWQPLHVGMFPVRYQVELWEVVDGLSPDLMISTMPPLWVKEVAQVTTIFLGPADPMLQVGRTYLLQVSVRDEVNPQGIPATYIFRNQGRSPYHLFKYGYEEPGAPCDRPESLGYDRDGSNHTFILWDGGGVPQGSSAALSGGQAAGTAQQAGGDGLVRSFGGSFAPYYTVHYREKPASGSTSTSWEQSSTSNTYFPFRNYKMGRTYQVLVEKSCQSETQWSDTLEIAFSRFFPEREYACGQEPLPVELNNFDPLQELHIMDTIMIGDTRVVLTEVSGSNGTFSGEGYFRSAMLKSVKIAVEFTSIKVNDEYRVVDGFIETKYDPTGSNIFDLDGLFALLSSGVDQDGVPEHVFNQVDSIVINSDGTITVFADGGVHTFDQPSIISSQAGKVLVSGGYQLPILEDWDSPTGLLPAPWMQFEAAENQSFGLDLFDARWGGQYDDEGGYKIGVKSVARGGGDQVVGRYTGTVAVDSIRFINSLGAILPHQFAGDGVFQIETVGAQAEDAIYAMTNNGCLGILYQKSYRYINYPVALVSLNGAGEHLDLMTLQNGINQILLQGVTRVTLSRLSGGISHSLPDGVIGASSRFMTVYSQDMEEILDVLHEQQQVPDSVFVLILVDNLEGDVAGFMPGGFGYGFVDVSKASGADLARLMAHELSHGMYNMRHFWLDYGGNREGDFDNLMDYGQGTRLLHGQWDRMHQPTWPSGWRGRDGDGQLANRKWLIPVEASSGYPYGWMPFMTNSDRICNSMAEGYPNGCIPGISNVEGCFTLDVPSGKYISSVDQEGQFSHLSITTFPNTGNDDWVFLFKRTGICGDDEMWKARWAYARGRYGSLEFVHVEDSLQLVSRIPCSSDSNQVQQRIAPFFQIIPQDHVKASEEDYNMLIDSLVIKLQNAHQSRKMLGNNYAYLDSRSSMIHIVDFSTFAQHYEDDEVVLQFEHHLAYLFDKTGTGYYVIYHPTNVTLANDQFNLTANRVLQNAGITDPIVLVTIPYTFQQNYPGSPNYGYIMPGIASNYGETFEGLNSNLNGNYLYDALTQIYKTLPKPHYLHYGYLRYDNGYVYTMTDNGIIRGRPSIHEWYVHYDKRNLNSINNLNSFRRSCLSDQDMNPEYCDQIYWQLMESFELFSRPENRDSEPLIFKSRIKPPYFDYDIGDGKTFAWAYLSNEFAALRTTYTAMGLGQYRVDLSNWSHFLYKKDIYDQIYNALDWASLALTPVGGDFIPELIGLAVAVTDPKPMRQLFNLTSYGIGVVTASCPILLIKKMDWGTRAIMLKVTKEALEDISSPALVKDIFQQNYQKVISDGVAQKVFESKNLKRAFFNDEILLQKIGNHPRAEQLLEDLATSDYLINFARTNPKGIESWDLIRTAIGREGGTKFARDPATLNRVAELIREGSVFRNAFPSTWEVELKDIISKNADLRCLTCGNTGIRRIPPMHEMLENIEYIIQFQSIPGFQSVMTNIKSNINNRDGIHHMIYYMKTHSDDFVNVVEFEFRYADDIMNKADVLVGNTKYEFKSWTPNAEHPWNSFFRGNEKSYTQFIRYLENTSNLNDLKYVFNKAKASESQVKNAFKELLSIPEKKMEIFNANPNLWKQFDRIGGGRIEDIEDFIELLNHSTFSINHPMFDFIKVF
jgi:hypothetical protein